MSRHTTIERKAWEVVTGERKRETQIRNEERDKKRVREESRERREKTVERKDESERPAGEAAAASVSIHRREERENDRSLLIDSLSSSLSFSWGIAKTRFCVWHLSLFFLSFFLSFEAISVLRFGSDERRKVDDEKDTLLSWVTRAIDNLSPLSSSSLSSLLCSFSCPTPVFAQPGTFLSRASVFFSHIFP